MFSSWTNEIHRIVTSLEWNDALTLHFPMAWYVNGLQFNKNSVTNLEPSLPVEVGILFIQYVIHFNEAEYFSQRNIRSKRRVPHCIFTFENIKSFVIQLLIKMAYIYSLKKLRNDKRLCGIHIFILNLTWDY